MVPLSKPRLDFSCKWNKHNNKKFPTCACMYVYYAIFASISIIMHGVFRHISVTDLEKFEWLNLIEELQFTSPLLWKCWSMQLFGGIRGVKSSHLQHTTHCCSHPSETNVWFADCLMNACYCEKQVCPNIIKLMHTMTNHTIQYRCMEDSTTSTSVPAILTYIESDWCRQQVAHCLMMHIVV